MDKKYNFFPCRELNSIRCAEIKCKIISNDGLNFIDYLRRAYNSGVFSDYFDLSDVPKNDDDSENKSCRLTKKASDGEPAIDLEWELILTHDVLFLRHFQYRRWKQFASISLEIIQKIFNLHDDLMIEAIGLSYIDEFKTYTMDASQGELFQISEYIPEKIIASQYFSYHLSMQNKHCANQDRNAVSFSNISIDRRYCNDSSIVKINTIVLSVFKKKRRAKSLFKKKNVDIILNNLHSDLKTIFSSFISKGYKEIIGLE